MVFEERDQHYMSLALGLARKALIQGEVPIGSIVVSPYGEILGRGSNAVERFKSQRHHAEVRAIDSATRKRESWRLDGCTLYVSLEPCMMCISLCGLSRIERVVYGADSPLFGYRLDKEGVLSLYTKHIKDITSGVMAEEAALILKEFFMSKRKGVK